MTWVHLQRATEASFDDYQKVQQILGEDVPAGLVLHVAGEEDGHWRSVSVWESESAWLRFRDQRLMPAVIEAFGPQALDGGPPLEESFEVRHSLGM
jgi:hypothetical protein